MVNDLTVTLFGHQALNSKMSFKDTLSLLQDLDLIDIGELAEKAVAKKTGVQQTSRCQEGYDLENGWEIKHGQAHANARGTQRNAYIAGMQNKTGTLRIVITERLTGQLYFFKVPFRAYKDYRGSSLQWAFEADGTPRRVPRAAMSRPCYWDYEVASFNELCS
jgi:hypothetical protein